MEALREYGGLLIAAIVAIGVLTVIAWVTESMSAVLVAGLILGILTGGFIARRSEMNSRKKRRR